MLSYFRSVEKLQKVKTQGLPKQNLKQTGNGSYIYQKELEKTFFKHGMAWDFKDLPRRTTSDKILHDKSI